MSPELVSIGTEASPFQPDFRPNPELYPFESRWFESSVGRIHYLDEWTGEGEGRPLLLMHGNPDWSFLYREMIPLLRPHFRCIAMDYPGFGLSAHPKDYGYLPSEHAAIVAELVEHLDLNNAVLVGQDWGGPIGFDVASRMPERFTGLVAGNTMMWSAKPFYLQRTFSRVTSLGFVQKSLMKRHTFVRRIMPQLLQVKPTDEVMRHYLDVAPTPASRIGHAVFPKAIVGESEWLDALEQRVRANLSHLPMLRIMGLKDVPLTTRAYLRKWDELWPKATKLDLANAGHFWQEDEPVAAAEAIIRAYARHPEATKTETTRPQTTNTNQEHTAMTTESTTTESTNRNTTLLVTFAKPNPDEIETFQAYVGASTELAVQAGADVSSRFAVEHLLGDAPAVVFGLATFPSADAITTMFNSDDYQALVPARDQSLESVNAYIVDDTEVSELEDPDGVYLVTVAAPAADAGEDLMAYQQVAGPISAKHGAVPVVNLPISARPVGVTEAAFIAIARFPSADAVQAFLSDPDYTPIIPTRDRALASLNLYVTAG